MLIKINAINFEATTRLEEFATKKVEKLVKHNEQINIVEVNMKVVKPETAMNKEVSIKLNIPYQDALFASKTADTFEEAVDMCIDALKRQLEKVRKDK